MNYPTEYYRTIRRIPSLVCYWRLNDLGTTAIDSAGKYNLNGIYNGAIKNDVSLIYPINNEIELFTPASKKFGESGQSVEIPDAVPLRITGDIAIETWISIYEEKLTCNIISKTNNVDLEGNPYELGMTSGKVHFGLGNGLFSAKASMTTVLPIGVPMHIVATSFRKEMKVFINGVVAATANVGSQKVTDAEKPIYIGSDPHAGGETKFNGLISEVAIYNSGMAEKTAREHFAIGRQIIYRKPYYTTYDSPAYS